MNARSIFALRIFTLVLVPALFWGAFAYVERRPIEHAAERVALASHRLGDAVL